MYIAFAPPVNTMANKLKFVICYHVNKQYYFDLTVTNPMDFRGLELQGTNKRK